MKGALKKLGQAGLAWATKQATSLAKQRGNKVLDPVFNTASKYPKSTAVAGVATGLLADAIFGGGDKEKQQQLFEQLKANGVIGNSPTQVSEEEFWKHMERAQEQGFDPVSMGLEGVGVGGLLGGMITPFVGGDSKDGISKNTADILSQLKQIRTNRARIKEDTGFDLGDEPTLDDLYGEMGVGGMYRKTENFTDNPWQWLTGGVKAPTFGRGQFGSADVGTSANPNYFKTESDRVEFMKWHNEKYQNAKTPEEKIAALRAAPAGYKKSQRYFDQIHSAYKSGYKGSDITSDRGKADFKQFVQGILGTTPPQRISDPATGVTSVNPAYNPNARTPEELIRNYVSPEGDTWDTEDAYRQSGMAATYLNGKPSAPSVAANVAASAQTPAPTPASIPAAVAASAAQPQTAAQQQQTYLASKNIRTATQADAELASSMKDPNSAFNAAMVRGGHNNARAMNMMVGKYASLDPNAFIPETVGVKGKGAVTYRERALGKHFATPALVEAKKEGDVAQPFYRGGNWVGNNIVTGEFKDPEGNIWGNEGQFRNSQKGEYGMVETDGMPSWMGPEFSWEAKDFDPIADAVRMGGLPPTQNGPTKPAPWTPEKGGLYKGRNMSRADSDPADFDPNLAAARKTLNPIFDRAKKRVNNLYGF